MEKSSDALALEIEELRRENEYLRSRNVELLLLIKKLESSLEDAGTGRKNTGKPGRKVRNADWQKRYEDVKESIRTGERPAEAMKRLCISKATYYRFRGLYLKVLSGENKEEDQI